MKKQTFLEYIKVISVSLAIFVITAVFGAVQFNFDSTETKSIAYTSSQQPDCTVVIDAGHGGEDGGALGISGIPEKDINLSISQKLYDMLKLFGVNTAMTRKDDRLLYESGQENRKKFYDVRNRVDFVNSVENPILISIHQNKFPIEKYFGLQVYFSKNNGDSKVLAETVQQKAREYLISGNNRKAKESGRNIYLLNNLDCPSVLVECGFLSNREEESLLIDEEYQRKVSFVIFSSVIDYISNNV